MPHPKAEMAEVAHRRAQLLRLRREGVRYDDERILSLGYSSASMARKDLTRSLEQNRDEEAAEVGVYRQQENERLDALLEAAWPRATKPSPIFSKDGDVVGEELDMRAVDTVLRLMDRRAKLNGLDVPVKSEISGLNGGPIALASGSLEEMEQLFNIARQIHTGDDGEEGDEDLEGEDADDDTH